LQRHGTRLRVYFSLGQKQYCQVERFYCPDCRQTFTRLPVYLIPYKRYSADEIEAALQHLAAGGTLAQSPGEADECTLRRWMKEFRVKMRDWAGRLEGLLLRLRQQLISLTGIMVNPFLRLQAVLSEYPGLPSHWTLLVKALHWLQKSHPHCLG
jgi:hypothetical protein